MNIDDVFLLLVESFEFELEVDGNDVGCLRVLESWVGFYVNFVKKMEAH